MYEYGSDYEKWFKRQAKELGNGTGGPPGLFDTIFPHEYGSLFGKSPHANPAGRFASMATTAALGRTVCDSAIMVSLGQPDPAPAWMSSNRADAYDRERRWEDLAASIGEHGREPFHRALMRAHDDVIGVALGQSRYDELRGRLSKELDRMLKPAIVKALGEMRVRMSEDVASRLIYDNLYALLCVRHAHMLARKFDYSYAVVPLTEELRHGLVVAVASDTYYGPHAAVVLTA